MGIHGYCEWNCGGTDCDAPRRVTSTTTGTAKNVMVFDSKSKNGYYMMTLKEAAIDEILAQPFFAPKHNINLKYT